jgi:hypothetical protein
LDRPQRKAEYSAESEDYSGEHRIATEDGLRQSGKVLQGMELRLARKPQTGSCIELFEGSPRDRFHVRQSGAMRGGSQPAVSSLFESGFRASATLYSG